MRRTAASPSTFSKHPFDVGSSKFSASQEPSLHVSGAPVSFIRPGQFFAPQEVQWSTYLSPSGCEAMSAVYSGALKPTAIPSFMAYPAVGVRVPDPFTDYVDMFITSLAYSALPNTRPASSLCVI